MVNRLNWQVTRHGFWSSDVSYLGTAGQFLTNQMTIVPINGLNYVGLGVNSYKYYYRGIRDGY
ncbi:hypothetical protein GCM10011607_42120 [Shewanella inventionis]|uniref:Uncharacterized protein n=1 Tax=Shewanella inventionis TaxID=1738770 RepID=A0ABQ1JYF6_9GAMM|nr:hypothetical protein GCM10011607_42120 [Shewanella inventionis]